MRSWRVSLGMCFVAWLFAGGLAPFSGPGGTRLCAAETTVTLVRLPDRGYQQQVVDDAKGVIHVVYVKGDAESADIFYTRLEPGAARFTPALRVNSQAACATALGTIRGPAIALGRNGRVHISWTGNAKALPRGPLNPSMDKDSPYNGTPFLYARLNDAGTGFEAQRNLMQFTFGLDGGGSLAADGAGHVYAVWHGLSGTGKSESDRCVYVSVSADDGKTFARETAANPNPWGACGCCALRAFTDAQGFLYVLYRSAKGGTERDMNLLISRDHGRTWQELPVDDWNVGQCVMSSAALTEACAPAVESTPSTPSARAAGESPVTGAWETKGQVFFATIDPKTNRLSAKIAAPGAAGSRKHPSVARNAAGETLLVWTEDTGWARGGKVAWQVFDRNGQPETAADSSGRKDGVPAWGLASAASRPDGSFVVIY